MESNAKPSKHISLSHLALILAFFGLMPVMLSIPSILETGYPASLPVFFMLAAGVSFLTAIVFAAVACYLWFKSEQMQNEYWFMMGTCILVTFGLYIYLFP